MASIQSCPRDVRRGFGHGFVDPSGNLARGSRRIGGFDPSLYERVWNRVAVMGTLRAATHLLLDGEKIVTA